MPDVIKRYTRKAKAVLSGNRTSSYTMPSSGLYPHQWNWDSAFIAIGYSHYNTKKAIEELSSLFKAQWKNGMLPQIVFNEKRLGRYFPEPDFWQAHLSPNASEDILTSGITMPPIHAVAALKIYENATRPSDVKPFLEWIYPKLIASHSYLYNERDPDGTGLVYIRHPWESGMDNSPMWDFLHHNIELSSIQIPAYERKDLSTGVDAGMRPKDDDYDRFVYLVDIFRRLKYDEKEIRKESPFLIYGPLFNGILSASNEALIKIADILGKTSREIECWDQKTKRAIKEKLFRKERKIFDFYDIVGKKLLDVDSAAGFIPLFGGAATKEQASDIYDYLNSTGFCALHQGNCYTIPNYDTQKKGFERENYWRGPVWININWMIMQGLRKYGYIQKADSIAKDILQLPIRFGFYEYFDSFDGRGYGSKGFSWTASLFIDTAYETYLKKGEEKAFPKIRKMLWSDVVLNDELDLNIEYNDLLSKGPLAQTMLLKIRNISAGYYSNEGRVDYGSIKGSNEYAEFKKLATLLKNYDIGLLNDEKERLAFWINLYNTIIVDGIISLRVKGSVKELPGFFKRVKYRICGFKFSPDDMEHGILRANTRAPMRPLRQFSPSDQRKGFSLKSCDPRIHFALVCGSRSCAPIKFYSSEGIYDELELAAKNFINSSEVIIIPEEKRILISLIFKWYEKDFGGRSGVLDFIERYTVDDDKREFLKKERNNLTIDYLYYDWNING